MTFSFDIQTPDFAQLLDGVEGDIAAASTAAMKRATDHGKTELRDQVTRAGFSERLARTWRGKVYPERRNSMNPAGVIWSNAPDIIDAFSRGATIRPVRGGRYLWIPTANVPPRRRGYSRRLGVVSKGSRMSPEEVEDAFNSEFTILPVKGGGLMAFIPAVRARNNRTERRANKGRARQGRDERLVAMFSLRRVVKMPKLLDIAGPANRAADIYKSALGAELGKR